MNSSRARRTLWERMLRLPLRFVPARARVPVLRGPLRGMKWIVGSSIADCWLGSYESDKQVCFARTVTRDSVVYDIGANVGFYTLLASVLVGPKGRVVAFEPMPDNLMYLREHLRLNGITNVTVIDKAVSNAAGTATFTLGASRAEGHLAPHGNLQVETVVLDDLIDRNQIPAPDLMKIDVEGAEMRVLAGAKSLLARRHPAIFLGTHAMPDLGYNTHEPCCRFLREHGYHLEPIGADTLEATDEILARYTVAGVISPSS